MPKRNDLHKILVIGSGPIVIGQACEFDYSGTQACESLKALGYEVVLVNSNPATIMTDTSVADRTYVEPITADAVAKVIARERPDALLPNMGGQTGLNCAIELDEAGVLDKYGVEVIGCNIDSIRVGEDRKLFAQAMSEIGLSICKSGFAYSVADAERIVGELGFPVIIRPSFTLGGAGGGIAYDMDDLRSIVAQGLDLSANSEVLVEESIQGWKEIEMEVMRDAAGNGIVICSIENLDPMGVHTGDSITVAPAQTLSDTELQRLRDYSLAILEKVGVATGGSNVQFAVNPDDGRVIVVEMNPRVSRSSALASKATGFPIAKVAARLAVGLTLDEITNDITGATPACFEPSIDYCVVKIPRFAFEKFKGTSDVLSTRMKAVGEVMAIGRTFEESFNKAARSLEIGENMLGADDPDLFDEDNFRQRVSVPTPERIFYVVEALRRGWSIDDIHELTGIDDWYLMRLSDIVAVEGWLAERQLDAITAPEMRAVKQMGFSDEQVAHFVGSTELEVRAYRKALGVTPCVKTVDTCGGEFPARTAYHYKCYDEGPSERRDTDRPRAMILSAGPNRIGQGIEFDYCCCHAAYALHDKGYETVMVNCNPETVSTDYDTSDRLYFEPLTFEDVMDIVDVEAPEGVICSLGGQTPINLAARLQAAGVPIMGTQPDAIDLAEDRDRFSSLLDDLNISYPRSGVANTYEQALKVADQIGFPLLVRPSYVLGGRGMVIAYDAKHLKSYMEEATRVSSDHPIYLDSFLDSAVELDVDALCDGETCYVGSVLEQIEEAGIHSGDSACCMPPYSLADGMVQEIRETTHKLAVANHVVGALNVQYAVHNGRLYVIELNPRASRTVPFSSKSTGVPLARMAARIMSGEKIADLDLPPEDRTFDYFACKEAVLPFDRFPGADMTLGPEMKSTGEVMGVAKTFPAAYAKTQLAISYGLPLKGTVFVSVIDRDKRAVVSIARDLAQMGFKLVGTSGTAKSLRSAGLDCTSVRRACEMRPNIATMVSAGDISLIINIPGGAGTREDFYRLRSLAVRYRVTNATTLSCAQAMVEAIRTAREGDLDVVALQDL
ncbi:MAG: carbamoyl-phosphate synthase large subunit [Atopobiaceae bacterium]|jgi:carbamoyl-phosphate synthase large subunit|nr:carbamoyl-phosphate synthase large subunit [Atopobiaceae bacterium]